MPVPPSQRLDHWLPTSRFREIVAVPSTAAPELLQQAFEEVTLREMPLARFLGVLRCLPAPFLGALTRTAGALILERTPQEIVVGMIVLRGEPVDVKTAEQFAAYHEPGGEKLVMSVRAVAAPRGTLLVLEQGTQPPDESARLRLRDWRWMRAGGAFVTRRLLAAVVRRAERPSQAARIRARKRVESFLVNRPAVRR